MAMDLWILDLKYWLELATILLGFQLPTSICILNIEYLEKKNPKSSTH